MPRHQVDLILRLVFGQFLKLLLLLLFALAEHESVVALALHLVHLLCLLIEPLLVEVNLLHHGWSILVPMIDFGLLLPLLLLPLFELLHCQTEVLLHVLLSFQMASFSQAHLLIKRQHVLRKLLFVRIALFLHCLAPLTLIQILLDLVNVLKLNRCIGRLLRNLVLLLVLLRALELFYHVPEAHLVVWVHLICSLPPILLLGFGTSHSQ